ncbi:signal recognition particle [Thraustotheca clavata]|uniref:Signal recognition particle subunit SRP68 n=1 Tax=Thraustotheca clavata TaxID=74557 RepID=A0A1V9YWD3_9STRA|nr:signal recognition particle [Thraustotheca clavata]
MGRKEKKVSAAAAPVVKVVPSVPLSLPILETIKFSQQQNGLRFGDYNRYRQHCARRLRRLRKGLKFMHGKGKGFVQKEVTADNAYEVRHLMLPLYHSERAWSYAMQLREDERNDKEENGDEASSRIKFHLLGRLKKAVVWSDKLATLCTQRGDARTSLEAEAYASYMAGNLALYKEEWKAALEKFTTAQRIYTELAKVGTSVQQDLVHQILEEISPFMRYCEYNLNMLSGTSLQDLRESTTSALLQSKIDQIMHEEAKTKAKTMAKITWKGREITIPSDDLSVAMVRPDEHLAKLNKPDITEKKRDITYVELFGCYDAILRMLANERSKTDSMKSGFMAEAQRENITALEEYVRFLKLTHTAERNFNLFTQLKARLSTDRAPGDMIHILEMLLQNIDDMRAVPGAEEHPSMINKYSILQPLFHAMRANYVAQMYLAGNKFAEAMTLFEHAKSFLLQADELYAKSTVKDADVTALLTELGPQVHGAPARVSAMGFLHSSTATENVRKTLEKLDVRDQGKSLLERQNEYSSGSKNRGHDIVKLPPSMVALPPKPLLFDIAFSEMAMPDIQSRIDELNPKSSGGFLGWLRG